MAAIEVSRYTMFFNPVCFLVYLRWYMDYGNRPQVLVHFQKDTSIIYSTDR